MSNLLVTPSIWNAVLWHKEAPGSWRDSALEQLTNQLGRVPMGDELPKPIQRGLDFESAVEVCTRRNPDSWEAGPLFTEVVEKCMSGKWQQVAKKSVYIDDQEYLLYGRIDVLFPDKIIDIKTTGKHRPPGHYLKGIQHKIYSYATGIKDFTYLVGVMDDDDKLVEVYEVDWHSPDFDELEKDLVRLVRIFHDDIKRWGLDDLYLHSFCRIPKENKNEKA